MSVNSMNTHLSVLFLSAILIASVGLTPSYAQVAEPIMVTTDKESYSDGETIMVSGEVRDMLSGIPVTLRVLAPNGNLVAVEQLTIGSDKKYSVDLVAGGTSWRAAGEYTISVVYGSQTRVADTTFDFGGSTGIIPKDDTSPISSSDTFSLEVEGLDPVSIGYLITGGSVNGMTVSDESASLIVSIDATDDGELTLTLPRAVIDAKMNGCEGDDDVFYILVDLEEVDFEQTKTDMDRTVTIPFFAGAEEIEIVGTCAIPEFGTIAALILAVAIVSIIAVSARSRLSIMPKY